MPGLLAALQAGQAWPQFLGPDRNGITAENLRILLPDDGPSVQWQTKVGPGFSGPVVAQQRVVLFHRRGDEEVIAAHVAGSGDLLWEHRYPTGYVDSFGFDPGPRGTPCIARGRVYTFGAEGRLTCVDLADGSRIWQVDTRKLYRSDQGFFGRACSPLVVDGLVLLHLGGDGGAGIAAFQAETGALAWKATDHEAGYASPVMAHTPEGPLALCFTREGLVGIEPQTGGVRFNFPWRSRSHASVNAASPLVFGDRLFLTASYGTGAVLLRLQSGGVQTIWKGDDSLSAHYAAPVRREGYLYGFHGRQEQGPSFRCIEWHTGKVQWSREGIGAGTVVLAGEKLVLLLESGELVFVAPEPDRYRELGRTQILGGDTRAPFAVADGFLYARDKNRLIALNLRPAL